MIVKAAAMEGKEKLGIGSGMSPLGVRNLAEEID
jgi:hypothetical protein